MTDRRYQQYPGQLNSAANQVPYPLSSPQSGYGAQRPSYPSPVPSTQGYPTPPPGSPQPLYQASYAQSPYGQPPQYSQQQGYGRPPPPLPQSYGGTPQQQGYGQPYSQQYSPQPPYPQNPGYGYGQPGQYPPQQQGGYPPQGGQQYDGAPSQSAGPQQVAAYKQSLLEVIREKNLHNMYPPNDPTLDRIANQASAKVDQLCASWRVPREVGQDIVKLALFDIILYIDDSGSMLFEEEGERIKDLRLILGRVAYAASLFDDDGISVRFMKTSHQAFWDERKKQFQDDHIKSEQQVERLMSIVTFSGLTPMGTELKTKVIDEIVLEQARSAKMRKPVLVITITDGQPAGEPQGAVFDAIRHASSELSRIPRYGQGAVSFQFAQVGNDLKAREFLGKLDSDPGIGHLIDCTSSKLIADCGDGSMLTQMLPDFEVEQDEMSRARPPVDLTPELWLVKLLLGAIDSSYDTKDEQGS
ncbi:MAG: hypothetical protein M1830_006150, partial [Pleopsidium flavum]